jgi:adhesin/invasin
VSAGDCTIRASQAGDSTHAAATPVDRTFAVGRRTITVTAVSDTKVADGTTTSSATPTITSGSLAAGDTGSWSQTFDTAAAGTGKTLTPAGTVAHGDDVTSSYSITFVSAPTGTITAAAADHLAVAGIASPVVAGTVSTVSVRAEDTWGNIDEAYAGTVHLASSDPGAVLPADSALVGGAGSFSVTLKTAGAQSVTATDTATSTITGSESAIDVTPGPLDHIIIVPASATIEAGASHSYAAEGFDAHGNSRGDVTADTAFTIAPDGSCTGASCTATVAGPHTVTGDDAGKSHDASLTVTPGAASATTTTITTAPTSIPADASSTSTITVQLKDLHGNDLTTSGGTVTLTADHGAITGLIDNGNGTWTATYTSDTTSVVVTVSGKLDGVDLVSTATVTQTPPA